jgi:hypothetical protein
VIVMTKKIQRFSLLTLAALSPPRTTRARSTRQGFSRDAVARFLWNLDAARWRAMAHRCDDGIQTTRQIFADEERGLTHNSHARHVCGAEVSLLQHLEG